MVRSRITVRNQDAEFSGFALSTFLVPVVIYSQLAVKEEVSTWLLLHCCQFLITILCGKMIKVNLLLKEACKVFSYICHLKVMCLLYFLLQKPDCLKLTNSTYHADVT